MVSGAFVVRGRAGFAGFFATVFVAFVGLFGAAVVVFTGFVFAYGPARVAGFASSAVAASG